MGGPQQEGLSLPNRILREGILHSDRVNELDAHAEVFYRRLMSVVDDYGRYGADLRLLRAHLYPLKLNDIREANLERWLAACESARLVRRYEVAGKRYLVMVDFRQRTRAMKPKFPDPPDEWLSDDGHVTVTCLSPARLYGDGDGDVSTEGDAAGGVSQESATESAFNLEALKGEPVHSNGTQTEGERLNASRLKGSQKREELLMERCRSVFGAAAMATYGGNWRNRARQNPNRLERVLNDTAEALKDGTIRETAAAYANDIWSRFK